MAVTVLKKNKPQKSLRVVAVTQWKMLDKRLFLKKKSLEAAGISNRSYITHLLLHLTSDI